MAGRLRPISPAPRTSIGAAEAEELVDLVGARIHIDVTVPRTEVQAKMRVVSRSESHDAKAATRSALQQSGFPVDATALAALGASDEWQYELAVRVLAVAMRDPRDTDRALASLDEWRECDDDQIAALWVSYEDLQARIDPVGTVALSTEEQQAILAAAKKKDVDSLTGFGSRRLALFLISSADQPAISPPPSS